MAKEITFVEYKQSTEHYDRMIECWKEFIKGPKCYFNVRPIRYLLDTIYEDFKSNYCCLCVSYLDDYPSCNKCPLALNDEKCNQKGTSWRKVSKVGCHMIHTIQEAKQFLKALQNMRKVFDKLPRSF